MPRIAVVLMVVTSVTLGGLACDSKVGPLSILPDSTSRKVVSVIVVPQTATVKIGDRVQIQAAVNAGAGITERRVLWSSSNPNVASVNAAGLVTPGIVAGTVIITAAALADTTVKGTSTVTVSASGAPGQSAQP